MKTPHKQPIPRLDEPEEITTDEKIPEELAS
jgi:hypothetical protein